MAVMKILVLLLILCEVPHIFCFQVDPVNQTVPVNTTASFFCTPSSVDPADVAWSIYFPDESKFYIDVDPKQLEKLTAEGFQFGFNDNTSFMNVTATVANNRTNIVCREFDITMGSPTFSDKAYLTVLGPPLPPGVIVSNPSSLEILLTWGEPFTWPQFPILNYTITETEVGTGNSKTLVTQYLNYSHTASRVAMECNELKFTVIATSNIGNSNSTIITTGLPIAPDNNFENFDALVRFKSNGDPEVTITIKPPPVCSYQEAQLLLEVLQVDSNESMLLVTKGYTGAPPTLSFHITRNLVPNTNYTLIAIVITVAGNTTEEWRFDTVLAPPSSTGLLAAVVGGVAGGVVLLVCAAIMAAVCFCMFLNYRTAKALQSSTGAMGMQECMYESIDDMQIKFSTTQTNQYQESYPIRPESPYQPMKSADLDTKGLSGLHDPLASPHYKSAPCPPMPLHTDISESDLANGVGDIPVFLSHESGPATTEDAYVAMNGAGSQRLSAISDANGSSGEYRLSIC